MKVKSKASKTQQGKGCTMSNCTSGGMELELPLFAIAELVPQNNEMTLIGKLPTCNPSIQEQRSSRMSGQDLTLKGKVCSPYWTDFCAEINSSLLLPVGIDSQDSDLISYNTWSSRMVDKSWFSIKLYTAHNQNLPRIYSQFFTSFPTEYRDSGNTLKKSKKIYLKMTSAKKQKIKYWFGVSRFVYNETIGYLQNMVEP